MSSLKLQNRFIIHTLPSSTWTYDFFFKWHWLNFHNSVCHSKKKSQLTAGHPLDVTTESTAWIEWAGHALTHYVAHTSHSEGLLTPGRLHRMCTARSFPPVHGKPGSKTHTHTHTWLKLHTNPVHTTFKQLLPHRPNAHRIYRRCVEHEIKGTSPTVTIRDKQLWRCCLQVHTAAIQG